ncbi:polyamine aminopropyltransferase [Cupriavidus sp. CuC1]|uniref:polyamine aminopropyltransferase n=1 Tax=Cupriavidus sp. CuC1 TaxID=3373131 RepID=UPI0037CDFF55
MQGLHLTADLYECRCAPALLCDAQLLASLCRQAVAAASLTLVAEKFHTFPGHQGEQGGVTGAALLAESHLAVHTWPERDGVTLDVYVCNFSDNNSAKAEALLDALLIAFAPRRQSTNRLLRGSDDPQDQANELLLEWLNPDSAYGFRATRRLETVRTAHQLLEVFDTPQWGKLLRLDGRYMTSERDEFFYHEPMVHATAITHATPRRALVLGGGDGGACEELLKYPTMERVVLAELDAEVIRAARQHLPQVHRGAFDDPRLQLRIGDGFAYMAEQSRDPHGERFDLVVLDLTDPDTPAQPLYTPQALRLVKSLLAQGGALAMHIGSPVFEPERVRQITLQLRGVFEIVRPFGLYVPLYGAYWGLAFASDTLDPLSRLPYEVDQRLRGYGIGDLDYYNGEVHRALFALPNYYQRLVQNH